MSEPDLPGVKTTRNRADTKRRRAQYLRAVVTDVPSDGAHVIRVSPIGVSGGDQIQRGKPASAIVPVPSRGDVAVPTEDDIVLLSKTANDLLIVEGVLYSSEKNGPEYEAGTRRIGHAATDSHVQIDPDGTVVIESYDGTTVSVDPNDGTVRVNDGTDGVITDVTTTKDVDGHVTDISLTRSDTVFV